MRVLLVEDDVIVAQALQEASYVVDWVENGEVSLSVLASQHCDIVLLDLGLPGKDGLEVLKTISNQENPVPLLIVTARDDVNDCIRGLDRDADD